MSFEIKTSTNINQISEFLASKIINELEQNKKVLWFVTGGSSTILGSVASKIIAQKSHANLTVMLTDERYGSIEHKDSNWQKLLATGFMLPQANLIPVLNGEDRATTTKKFNENLEIELAKNDYKIGLFGVGADGHTAGILPESEATKNEDLACAYDSASFERITLTFNAIKLLDEAVIFMQGEEKWPVIKDLEEKEIDIRIQPAQILKSVPRVTLFTDYQNKL